ncbi:hypothetical protein [Pseudoteredinibacter isoporae]|uniref:hypothetical protein n=1 Tax=Pseudoteredinibacter isoporae TaxID=570281 RepID=UPI00310980A4
MKFFKISVSGLLQWVLFGSLTLPSLLVKASDENFEALVAAENIAILSQSIVKNYFYMGNNLNSSASEKKLSEEVRKIDGSLALLADSSGYKNIQDDFEFVEMIWSDFKDSLLEPYSRDNGLLIIDMGEVMLEGSENLVGVLRGNGVKDGDRVSDVELQRYLIERMAKLYIVSIAGLKDFNVEKQMKLAVKNFDDGMRKIEDQSYPQDVSVKVNRLRQRWDASQDYYLNVKEGDLPKTVFFNTEIIERYLISILNYYKNR